MMSQDEQYLKIVSIFHYVVGAMSGLFACFPIFHFVIGIGMLFASVSESSPDAVPLMIMGGFFSLFAGAIMVFGWTFAVCLILAGRFLATRTRYMFCLVMAGAACIFMPFGTVLGVFTIIVLIRPSVKDLFEKNQSAELVIG